jgi:hypothetical protein
MKNIIYKIIVVVIYLTVMKSVVYACPTLDPVASFDCNSAIIYMDAGSERVFTSTSYDPDDGDNPGDGIAEYHWYLDGNGIGEGNSSFAKNFYGAGEHYVYLYVTDNDEETDGTCEDEGELPYYIYVNDTDPTPVIGTVWAQEPGAVVDHTIFIPYYNEYSGDYVVFYSSSYDKDDGPYVGDYYGGDKGINDWQWELYNYDTDETTVLHDFDRSCGAACYYNSEFGPGYYKLWLNVQDCEYNWTSGDDEQTYPDASRDIYIIDTGLSIENGYSSSYIAVNGTRAKLNLSLAPFYYLDSGYVTIAVTSGTDKAKICLSPDNPSFFDYITLDLSTAGGYMVFWNFIAYGLYVQGIDPSSSLNDVTITLYYSLDYPYYWWDYSLYAIDYSQVNFTVADVKVYIDSAKTTQLTDWPATESLLRSPKYLFCTDNAIYVEVKGIGTNPSAVEEFTDIIKVTSAAGGPVYLTLKETGANTNVFDNITSNNELLYLSDADSDNSGSNDTIIIQTEEVLTFSLRNSSNSSYYTESYSVMVDRAEFGTEYQVHYHPKTPADDIDTDRFGFSLHYYYIDRPQMKLYPSFRNADLESKPEHWKKTSDWAYSDSVDLASWSGHSYGSGTGLYFVTDTSPYHEDVARSTDLELGNKDAEWVIFDTCYLLNASLNDLKTYFLNSGRNAHMYLGFVGRAYWNALQLDGEVLAYYLEHYSIKDAWQFYLQETQTKNGTTGRVFYANSCVNETLANDPGPIEVQRDPKNSDNWSIYDIVVNPQP